MGEDYAAARCPEPIGTPRVSWHDGAVTSVLTDSPFVRACRGLEVPHTPVWFMRQAGRSLPEYRKIREGVGMLESCR
ncbi:MAG TPA: uroporphyrinogen decarboxylase family protein, partial [Actinoplanes sp.]|nr:uroporphyrinogen decarboxylase family protein [Actinoplanes sp.]